MNSLRAKLYISFPQDWFHESCLNLRERPSSREATPEETEHADISENDAGSETSSGLPPPLISASDYESFMCRSCVLKNPSVRKWAGTENALMVVRDTRDHPWKIINKGSEDIDVEVVSDEVAATGLSPEQATGSKRPHEHVSGVPEDIPSKRTRVDSAETIIKAQRHCTAPQASKKAQEIFATLLSGASESDLGAGDVFLVDEWRSQWCRCDQASRRSSILMSGLSFTSFQCLPALEAEPYLLEEEETYEPPEDPDSSKLFCSLAMIEHL